jgi:hypothetical protein
MKPKVITVIAFFFFTSWTTAQHINGAWTYQVFVDRLIVRAAPFTSSKIIGQLAQNTTVDQNWHASSEQDSIGGVKDYWIPIRFGNSTGYIWRPFLADGVFKSKLDSLNTILINLSSKKELEFKIFNKNTLKYSFAFERKNRRPIAGSYSFGKTFNSNGNELIAILYEDASYELFEWNSHTISPSKVKLNDDSFITGKYQPYEKGIINADAVNIRATPDTNAAIVGVLGKNAMVPLLKICHTQIKIKDEWGCWHCIRFKDKEAYVRSDFIDIPLRYIKSNKKENESFLFTNKAIYAFDGEKMLDRVKTRGDYSYSDAKFIDFGSRGLADHYQILGICYSANSCGAAGGDQLYLWDGNKLKYFGEDYAIGDGGFSEVHALIFPDQAGGIKDRIVKIDSESGADETSDGEEDSHDVFSGQTAIMEFKGDSLVEVPSPHLKLRKHISANFPKYELIHYKLADLNNDGLEDAIFLLGKNRYINEDIYLKPIIGYTLSDSTGDFSKIVSNKNLMKAGYYNVVKFTIGKNSIEINIKYNTDGEENQNRKYSRFVYLYDPAIKGYYWYSKKEAFYGSEEKVDYFKSKKILFENSWESD